MSDLETYKQPPTYTDEEVYDLCYNWYIENQKVLPENAAFASKIWIQKYALRDKTGMCLETTPEDMWHRLSHTLAIVELETNKKNTKTLEEWEELFYNNLKDFKGVPGGSALSVLGNGFVQSSVSNCFDPQTKVLTLNAGVKNIIDVKIGDTVVTHKGNTAVVAQVHANLRNDRDMYEVTCFGTPAFKATGNHKFLCYDSKNGESWKSIESLSINDYIAIPSKASEASVPVLSLTSIPSSVVSENNYALDLVHDSETDTAHLVLSYSYLHGNSKSGILSTPAVKLASMKSKWVIDSEFARFMGLWYGDGCVFHRKTKVSGVKIAGGIAFTFNSKETQLVDFVSATGANVFGLTPTINSNSNDHTTQVVFHSTLLGHAFSTFFGSGFADKKLHSVFNQLNKTEVAELLRGLIESDGLVTKTEIRIILKNVGLMESFFHLFRLHGMPVRFGLPVTRTTNFGSTEGCARLSLPPDSCFLSMVEKTYADNRIASIIDKNSKKRITTPYRKNTIDHTFVQVTKLKKMAENECPEMVYTLGVAHEDHSFMVEGLLCQNCFVVGTEDSLEGIMKTASEMARIQSFRGGTGIDISTLRPAASSVNNSAKFSTGAVSFMDFFSKVTATVGQAGRSGATMISIDSHHPDIEAFIEEKQDLDKAWFLDELKDAQIDINDWKHTPIATRLKSTSKANVSIKAYDAFMTAVENDTEYELWYEFKDGKYPRISKTVRARDLWAKFVKANVSSAEPGILFWDTILRESVSDCYAGTQMYTVTIDGKLMEVEHDVRTVSTNPCQPDYTRMLTRTGYKQLRDICVGEQLWTGNQWSVMTAKWSTGIKQVNRYHLSNNLHIDATEDHKVVSNKTKIEIGLAKSIDRMQAAPDDYQGNAMTTTDHAVLAGLVFGDGSKQKNGGTCAYLNIGINDVDVVSWLEGTAFASKTIPALCGHCEEQKLEFDFSDLHLAYAPLPEKEITEFWLTASKVQQAAFLRGLYSANGSVIAGTRVSLKTTNKQTAISVADMLANFGMRSFITINEAGPDTFSNGTYICKQSYDVTTLNVDVFAQHIGFIQGYKNDALTIAVNERKAMVKLPGEKVRITEAEPLGKMEVWDYTVEAAEHTVTQHGLLISNCAELPLPVGSACTLLSQNLTQYIINPWTDTARFDSGSFVSDIRISTRMLDNIKEYDISRLPLLVNKVDAILCRRIGLGCHGLADALAAMGLKYDTAEAIKATDTIYTLLANTVYDESVTLGIEKGVFQIWDWEKEKNNPFLNRLYPEVINRIKKFGRRNIACLTNAPTGSISILSRNCSSGIEPIFKLKYLRNIKKQGSEETTQHIIYHQAAQDCLNTVGVINDVFVEAGDINWMRRIEMQATIQKSIDHSISSTLNLPAGTTEDTVSNIYMAAWKSGLKGVTIYVDGSRSGVLVSADKKINKIKFPVERPKTTNVAIHKTRYKDKNYMILVGKMDEMPIEVFGGEEPDGLSLPTKYSHASLTKKSRGQYSLQIQLTDNEEDVLKISDISARFPAGDIITITRMISLSLRNGISISEICEQLSKASSALYDAPAVFARVLKLYITDAEMVEKETAKKQPCPDCKKELQYKREGGCLTAYCDCGYSNSKCG